MKKFHRDSRIVVLLSSLALIQASYAATWKIHPKPVELSNTGYSDSYQVLYLYYYGEIPKLSKIGSVEDSRFERIVINEASNDVYLNAEAYETASDKLKEKNKYQCSSAPDTNNRKVYSLCSSRFGLKGTSGYEVNIPLLQSALEKNDLDSHAAQSNAEQYEIAFTQATTEYSVKDFISKYKGNDPKNYIPKLQARLQATQLQSYRDLYRSIDQAPNEKVKIFYLKNFISKFEKNDPDRLVESAKAKLSMLQQSQNQKRATVGAKVCTTTFSEIETACSLGTPRVCTSLDSFRYKGTVTISGFVENVNPPNIKITTSAIRFQNYGDIHDYILESAIYNGGKLQAGTPFWDRIDNWHECSL